MSIGHVVLWRFILFGAITYSFIGESIFLRGLGVKKTAWKVPPPLPPPPCLPNTASLSNLVNLVCSTAQPANATNRDACFGCFSRSLSIPPGQPQLLALALCAGTYFQNTPYLICAINLANTVNNAATFVNQNAVCIPGYCEFVQCLRSTNSNNIIIQCSREVLANGVVNPISDANSVRYYTNMTSCILSKIRCGLFNPITGEPQIPGLVGASGGVLQNQVRLYNSLQVTPDGALRIISIPGTISYPPIFCSSDVTFSQSSWLNNQCP